MFELQYSPQAEEQLIALSADHSRRKRHKAVAKALRLLATNPRHPGLNTHEFHSETCPHGDKVWEAYAENDTPGAYRIFFCYGRPQVQEIYVLSIEPHR